MKQRIQFTGRHLDDIFAIPCVSSILKSSDGAPFLTLKQEYQEGFPVVALTGDWLVEEDNGKWHIETEFSKPM